MKKKNYHHDPIPIKILTDCFPVLSTYILQIVNDSLQTGSFPSCLKHATVTPVIKDTNGDHEDLKNYRPISNTPKLAKIIEKCALSQISAHLQKNDLNSSAQSASKEKHSCETAIFKVVNDMQSEIKKNNLSVILMLDLSAAFDTIDQTRLLNKLEACFFIRGNALKFIESYIKGRTYSVFLNGKSSNRCQLDYGVPQGSILGPKLFSMYIQDVEEIAIAHRIEIHSYADDTNLYLGFKPMGEFGASMEKN